MFILKYVGAPGTRSECPPYFKEYAYNETVEVINGIAKVRHPDTRDLLIKFGFVDITSEYLKSKKEDTQKKEGRGRRPSRRSSRQGNE